MNSSFLSALQAQGKGLFPIWIMRQAGRYLPSYQKLKQRYRLKELFKTPELACEVMLLPFQDLPLDAAILFSDITLVLEALGCEVNFIEGKGPYVEWKYPDLPEMDVAQNFSYLEEILLLSRPLLSVPIVGFCGGPLTVFCYLFQDRYPFRKVRAFLWQYPEKAKTYLEKIQRVCLGFLQVQQKAGIDAVQIFESHMDLFPYDLLKEFCFPYLKKMCQNLSLPTLIYAPGCYFFVEEIIAMQPQGISIDARCSLSDFRKKVPTKIALQGNFPPELFFAPPSQIETEVIKILQERREDPAYIVNLSEGIWPNIEVKKLQFFIEKVKEYAPNRSHFSPAL